MYLSSFRSGKGISLGKEEGNSGWETRLSFRVIIALFLALGSGYTVGSVVHSVAIH